tara:strand:+ start:777 stop:989 length:213 start_codon:yes stop_codon:yes gene_type:complete
MERKAKGKGYKSPLKLSMSSGPSAEQVHAAKVKKRGSRRNFGSRANTRLSPYGKAKAVGIGPWGSGANLI